MDVVAKLSEVASVAIIRLRRVYVVVFQDLRIRCTLVLTTGKLWTWECSGEIDEYSSVAKWGGRQEDR